jgi:hypothetical protein
LKLTVEDTGHIPLEEIEREKAEGLMSEDLIQQEYYTSFEVGIEGSYYSKYLNNMRLKGQITNVPWEAGFKVFTAWDIGVSDQTVIIFYQIIGQQVRIIDCYCNTDKGLDHYAKILGEKPYAYGKHIAPHDIRVREFGATGGMSRLERARNLGINFTIAPGVSIDDGIEAVRASFSKVWIDETNCAQLLKALENYRREYDSKKKCYKDHPLHDWSSDFCDAFRMMALTLSKTQDGMSKEDIDRNYKEHILGNQNSLPKMFQDPLY